MRYFPVIRVPHELYMVALAFLDIDILRWGVRVRRQHVVDLCVSGRQADLESVYRHLWIPLDGPVRGM